MNGIKKIVLELNKKELEFSLDEARELKDILNKLFAEEKNYVTINPVVYPYIPVEPYRYWKPYLEEWKPYYDGVYKITCTTNTE